VNPFTDPAWDLVPFHFWTCIYFILGAMVGSLLNVCIHRMPRGESVVWPPSHCPKCNYKIPGYLNIPIFTWLFLRGKCANCKEPISIRYLLIELFTAFVFVAAWLRVGGQSTGLALAYCLILSAFIVATFIDFEHFIIPDEITIGGIVAGFACSAAVPLLHMTDSRGVALQRSLAGIVVGGGLIYLILRGGKLLFGRYQIALEQPSTITFTEEALLLPNEKLSYGDIFYRKNDVVVFDATQLEMVDRCYRDVRVKLSPEKLLIGEETFNPDEVRFMEATTSHLSMPREAMGFGDVKFMAAIGAFLGWQSTLFSLMISSVLGLVITGVATLIRGKEFSSRIPYGPYIAGAAVIWMFAPGWVRVETMRNLDLLKGIFTGRMPLG
jgi:leader peptidase (prepilin peptidase)/N-methyltransferase